MRRFRVLMTMLELQKIVPIWHNKLFSWEFLFTVILVVSILISSKTEWSEWPFKSIFIPNSLFFVLFYYVLMYRFLCNILYYIGFSEFSVFIFLLIHSPKSKNTNIYKNLVKHSLKFKGIQKVSYKVKDVYSQSGFRNRKWGNLGV